MQDYLLRRPRRLRRSQALRDICAETNLQKSDFVWPVFISDSEKDKSEITSMPDVYRWSPEKLLKELDILHKNGLRAIALFPHIEDSKKDSLATESYNENGFLQKSIQTIKKNFPELTLITDVAMDPYSTDGHDGIVKSGEILNDETLEILSKMALSQAHAGADIVAPSDMMDGRVAHIRNTLDQNKFSNVSILSYTAKYASNFYGPFRDALDSAPKSGDKKSYQMNYSNTKAALLEMSLDLSEGADILMVKPAHTYLDIIKELSQNCDLPIAAYHVSGEYSMIKAAAKQGWINEKEAYRETLTSIKRSGAQIIFSYCAPTFINEI